jgi:transposase InsO family protein
LSDQGSNVDGEVVKEMCVTTGIEKRRSSAYHSQGNGFAERNIRNVKEILRTVLLHRKMEQRKWRQVLPELVFALNCSESTAIRCVPYNVVFGRTPVLPLDIDLGTKRPLAGEEFIKPTESERYE